MNFQIELFEKDRKLFEEFLEEFKKFNEHLQDYKEMIAPLLGFKVTKKEST